MNVYLLYRKEYDYDGCNVMVVVAESETEARLIASETETNTWLIDQETNCISVNMGSPGVVVKAYCTADSHD